MSDESDAGPHHKRKRSRPLEESSPSTLSSDSSPTVWPLRRRTNGLRNPIQESTDSDSDSNSGSSSIVVIRKKKRVARVSSDSDSDSSGSSIVERRRRTARLRSDSYDGSDRDFRSTSAATSQWETDFSDDDQKNAVAKPVQDNVIDSDSSDGQSDKCPICLIRFKNQEIGTPESCDHMFCLECIQEWSKNMNTCPVDRQEYNIILVRRHMNGKIVNQLPIQKPEPQNEVNIIEDLTFCEICGSSDQEDRMLLCDGCDLGFHLFCLTPPLQEVPTESWFCNDCSPDDVVDTTITLYEIQLLLDDASENMDPTTSRRSRRRTSPRLVPRTRQTERVRTQIATNRLNQARNNPMPSASTGRNNLHNERVSSTTSRRRKKKRISRKRRYVICAKPKTVKKRLAVQLGICKPKSVPQNLPDVRVTQPANSIGVMRHQAGIPALHLFGRDDDLDFVSDENEDYGQGNVLIRRAPNYSDVSAMRRAARRKAINLPSTVSSTNDILGSILNTQERFHSRNTQFSIDENGKFKMEPKTGLENNNYIKINQQKSSVRQRPTSYNNTGSTSNNYVPETETSSEYTGRSYEQHSTPSSTMESSSNPHTSGGGNEQDMPQDYSQRTLCASYEPTPEQDKNKNSSDSNSRSDTPNSESEIDIYSDIETVSTSKVDEAEYKPNSPPNSSQHNDSNTANSDDEHNESDTDMVIDTEREHEKAPETDDNKEETKVTSTVDSNFEGASDMLPSYSNSGSEIQSEAVQSTNQIGDTKSDYNDKDQDEDDVDSEDGCPNFSIYSRESINLAKDSDITLANNEGNQIGEISSSPSYDPERPTDDVEEEMPPEPEDLEETEQADMPQPSQESTEESEQLEETPSCSRPKKTSSGGGGLYSDSEDETVVRKQNSSFAINDIRNMTEDISEEERSYTPCLDEKGSSFREGIEGLDTEMISDEDRNDFDESHEHKTVSDGGDALEINAKESELDFTRPEDYEEGEIVDKSKKKAEAEKESKTTEEEAPKKAKKKDKTSSTDKEGNKENEGQNKEASFKKLSKSSKDRNYREKDRSKSKEKKGDKSEKDKEKDKREKKKEKRKELERYDVRALIADKPRRHKDQFGRDIRQSTSRSRSRSFTPPVRRSTSRRRSVSRTRRSPTPKRTRGRSRTRKAASRSRSRTPPRRRSRSKIKKTKKRSLSRPRKPRKSRDRSKTKKKPRSLSRNRSRSKSPRRKRNWNRRRSKDWTPSFSRSPTPEQANVSPSWTPPRLVDKNQPNKQHNLKVILANDAGKKKKDKKKKAEKRKDTERQRKRRHERTPPPSKEVFASGDNILVSVSFNKENETRDVTTRDKRRKAPVEEPPKKKKKKNKTKKDVSGLKPVAIIDLERSPFKELTPSPKDVIVLTDSENGDENDLRSIQKGICDSSQQVASPERIVNSYTMGPKTPPEPQIKFSLNPKQPTVRAITNPLHETDDMETGADQEDISDSLHKGPNTPPEPPNSPPSSPDAYDPFEPTKSRSPTPEPMQTAQMKDDGYDNNISDGRQDDKIQTPDALKSLTPPVADIQPADSQSSIHATPDTKSPERIGVVINQVLQPTSSTGSKPVAQTTPFSSVPTSLVNAAPISNLAPPRINILNSTIVQPSHVASSIPQRIVLPNIQKSSPVKIAPTKSIKPMPSKVNQKSRKSRQNGTDDSIVLDLDSPYSPGSSDYEDLFEPPPESMAKSKGKSSKGSKNKSNTFDALFGSPSYNTNKKKNEKVKKVQVSPTKVGGTKTVGVKLDEDNLKILDELPNSAVEMQVKDKYLKKLNRQERVVEEVKMVLKPHYNKKRLNKEEYKDILRRSVPKICHNKSGEINPTKIKNLIEAYVKKIRQSKKVTSSSSVNPQKV